MTAHNDITGDALKTKGATDAYRDGWDRIFGKPKPQPAPVPAPAPPAPEEIVRSEVEDDGNPD